MSQEIQAGERFALTFAGSLILHLALAFGIQVRSQADFQSPGKVIQARIVEQPPGPPLIAEPVAAAPPSAPEAAELRVSEALSPPPPAAPLEPPTHESAPAPTESMPSAASVEATSNLPSIDVPLIEDTNYYPATQVDVHPAALQAVAPTYPQNAVKARVSGSVMLVLLLDEGGKVEDISVETADPPGYFEESALAAFRNAKFSPAQRNGKVVKSKVRIKVNYDLVGSPEKSSGGAVR